VLAVLAVALVVLFLGACSKADTNQNLGKEYGVTAFVAKPYASLAVGEAGYLDLSKAFADPDVGAGIPFVTFDAPHADLSARPGGSHLLLVVRQADSYRHIMLRRPDYCRPPTTLSSPPSGPGVVKVPVEYSSIDVGC